MRYNARLRKPTQIDRVELRLSPQAGIDGFRGWTVLLEKRVLRQVPDDVPPRVANRSGTGIDQAPPGVVEVIPVGERQPL